MIWYVLLVVALIVYFAFFLTFMLVGWFFERMCRRLKVPRLALLLIVFLITVGV